MVKDTYTPRFCPNELGIDSWRFRLKRGRYGEWNGEMLGDIPNEPLKALWEAESIHPAGSFVADKLLGEIIRRGLIGDGPRSGRRKKRRRPKR